MKRRGSRPKICSHGASFSLISATFDFLPGIGSPWVVGGFGKEERSCGKEERSCTLAPPFAPRTKTRWYSKEGTETDAKCSWTCTNLTGIPYVGTVMVRVFSREANFQLVWARSGVGVYVGSPGAQTWPAMQRRAHECGGGDFVQRALARVRRFRRSDFQVRLVPPLREREGRCAQPRLSSSSSESCAADGPHIHRLQDVSVKAHLGACGRL